MGELVGTPLLALFFFILWGWFGRKADPSGAMKKFWPWIYARLNKATHPANTVGCSDRDWLVIYAEGGTPFIVYKFTAVCVPLAWTGDSGSRGKYWPA